MEPVRRLLFVINKVSGRTTPDWDSIINNYFKSLPFEIEMYPLPDNFSVRDVRSKIEASNPDCVVAVGGDGTVNLLATCIINTDISLAILPAGSANGMAKELGIGAETDAALKIIEEGVCKKISAVDINGRISLHLSDLGLNAFMLREFEKRGKRGLIGYIIATIKVLRMKRMLKAEISYGNTTKNIKADIILIANATTYGTGVVVNPVGKLDDKVFEIIAIKDLTVGDLLKASLTTLRLDDRKAQIFQVSEATLHCAKPAHFQVDGEYLGKVQEVKAKLLPDSLRVIVPGAQ
jgi:diacylglycerol kinase family enzyme